MMKNPEISEEIKEIKRILKSYPFYFPEKDLNFFRKVYTSLFSKRINVLFQTLTIMLVLFIPIFLTIKDSLEGISYFLYLVALLFFGFSFLFSMYGFLNPLDLSLIDNYKGIKLTNRYWNIILLHIPILNLMISLGNMTLIFIIFEYDEIINFWPYLFILTGAFFLIIGIPYYLLYKATSHPRNKWKFKKYGRIIKYEQGGAKPSKKSVKLGKAHSKFESSENVLKILKMGFKIADKKRNKKCRKKSIQIYWKNTKKFMSSKPIV